MYPKHTYYTDAPATLQSASQAEPIHSPHNDHPAVPHKRRGGRGGGGSGSGSVVSGGSGSVNMHDALITQPDTTSVDNTTTINMTTAHATNTTDTINTDTTNHAYQYLHEPSYITQPEDRDLLYTYNSTHIVDFNVNSQNSDFTISQCEDDVVGSGGSGDGSGGSSGSGNTYSVSASVSGVVNSVRTDMPPPTTLLSPIRNTTTTNTTTNTNTNTTTNTNTNTPHSTANSQETQSYQSPAQQAPIVMINNNVTTTSVPMRNGVQVSLGKYKIRKQEGEYKSICWCVRYCVLFC